MRVRAMAAGTTELHGEIIRLRHDAIRHVEIKELPDRHYPDYSERPTRYMVTLKGEKRPRRVYATPIGNVSVLYLKSHGHEIYCENALDAALYRNNWAEGKQTQ